MSSRRLSRSGTVSRWDKDEEPRAFVDRRLSKKGPAGVIFMCNSKTKRDCLYYKVLGLPSAKRDLVEQIVPGTFLFLFDFDARELHGVYEAVTSGGMNLEPKAFQGQGSYPAQVRFDIYRECLPISEDVFKDAIRENYFARNKFHLELTPELVSRLIRVFCPVEPPRKRLHMSDSSNVINGAEHQRQRLPERPTAVPARVDHVNRDSQHRLPAQALRIEERIPRQDILFRSEPGPLPLGAIDKPRLPEMRALNGQPVQTGLLTQGRMDEVDQLALRYLQPVNPTIGTSLDPRGQVAALPSVEGPRVVPSLQPDAAMNRALEAEWLRRIASERMELRGHSASHLLSGPDLNAAQLALLRANEARAAGSLSAAHYDSRRRR